MPWSCRNCDCERTASGSGSWSNGTSIVMSCEPAASEVVLAALVVRDRSAATRATAGGRARRSWRRRSRSTSTNRFGRATGRRRRRPRPVDERGPGTELGRGRQDRGTRVEAVPTAPRRTGRRGDVDERLTPAVVEDREAERQVVEQLVGDHDTVERVAWHRRPGVDVGRVSRPLDVGHLDRHVPQSRRARRRRGEHRSSQRPRPGTGVDDGERVGPTDPRPLGVEEAGDDRPEQRPDLRRRDEVPTPPGVPPPTDV